jgi:hypothetical protein
VFVVASYEMIGRKSQMKWQIERAQVTRIFPSDETDEESSMKSNDV